MEPVNINEYRLEAVRTSKTNMDCINKWLDFSVNPSLDTYPGELSQVINEWISEVSANKTVFPQTLRSMLKKLSCKIADGQSVGEEVRYFLILSEKPLSEFFQRSNEGQIQLAVRAIASMILKCAITVRTEEFISIVLSMWLKLVMLSSDISEQELNHRRKLLHAAGSLAHWLGVVNVPASYEILVSYLNHPWPEIRNRGAFDLRNWRAPGLVLHVWEALMLNEYDPKALQYSDHLIRLLAEICDSEFLVHLRELENRTTDSPVFQKVIKACEMKC